MPGCLELGGLGHSGSSGGLVVVGGEAEQMVWGLVDFAVNADLF